jgi:G3E family GTPase
MSIPFHLITGFLGSGKTTFLMHYLDAFSNDRKIGAIQNEFSSASVDGIAIRQNKGAYQMLEINNGSVFCVCLLGSFIESLSSFIDDFKPDEIIMEASGMSDPVSIGQIFQSPKLRNKVYLHYSWTIVDSKNFDKVKTIRTALEHQIRIADTIVVNKSDLVDDMESVIKEVKKINPFASIEQTSFGLVNFDRMKRSSKFFLAKDNLHSSRPDLKSAVIKSTRLIRQEELKEFIDSVKSDFIRFKGYVNTGINSKVIVQGTFEDYNVESVEWFPGITEMVGIGSVNEVRNYTQEFENYCR